MAARRAVIEAVIRNENRRKSVNRVVMNVREFCSGRRNCSGDENISFRKQVNNKDTENLPESDDSKTNMAYGNTVIDGSTGEWLTLDQKVNSYPSVRRFTAIGLGGDDFVKSMVVAVESVIQHSIPTDHVTQRLSSGRKYVSVNIGPVRVVSSEQVRAVYNAMRSDDRMKFFL